ncbi:hypothetical protein [Alkalicoccobacillus plakortidis]|uniref:Uncharacterized protein n=1 Tax=Alkalicoccobacillus plakortidis TaxID=444060 RepID=A0ABT0XKT9_9BACI|nr:hypothetical protein [Alkalicoccobacillus plakortidis]MCM2676524.1 hypothetical protein [Alkalicoccobacillus plakortidis]
MDKHKRNIWIAFIGSVIIIAVTVVTIIQISRNHQENMAIIEQCFEKFEQEGSVVVVEKKSFWSPVTCEKN